MIIVSRKDLKRSSSISTFSITSIYVAYGLSETIHILSHLLWLCFGNILETDFVIKKLTKLIIIPKNIPMSTSLILKRLGIGEKINRNRIIHPPKASPVATIFLVNITIGLIIGHLKMWNWFTQNMFHSLDAG